MKFKPGGIISRTNTKGTYRKGLVVEVDGIRARILWLSGWNIGSRVWVQLYTIEQYFDYTE